MLKYFGTDGVRGVANQGLTPEMAFKLGRDGGYVLTKNKKDGEHHQFRNILTFNKQPFSN